MDNAITIIITIGIVAVILYFTLRQKIITPPSDALNKEKQEKLEAVAKRLKEAITNTSAEKRKEDEVEKYYNDNN